jgi:hypothetical protein
MRVYRNGAVCLGLVLLLGGCGNRPLPPAAGAATGGRTDPERVRSADVSILFVGNSHTMMHDVPGLVRKMIEYRHPEKKVYVNLLGVAHLDDVVQNPQSIEEIESHPWKYVVLQAQKISMSGRFDYSKKEGIEVAKRAKDHGACVFYFSEWGRKDVAEEGSRTEKIYQAMASAAGVEVAPIGRAWDLALAERPELPLHHGDGNHQSALGAFLTACVLYGRLTGESPAALASCPYADVDEKDRKFLADAAAKALAQGAPGGL